MPIGFDKPLEPQGIQKFNPKIRDILQGMDLQQKSRFDFLLFRNPFDSVTGLSNLTGNLLGAGVDIAASKIYVQSITIPTVKIMYDRINGDVYTKDIEYPESIQIKFIEDERGFVMRYLQNWFRQIMVPASASNTKRGYVFKDNQEAARRTGILLLANSRGKFPTVGYPRITFFGLCPKDIGDITVSHDEKDNLTYDVNFSVRDVRISQLI